MHFTPQTARNELTRYLYGEGLLASPDPKSEENKKQAFLFTLAAINYITREYNGLNPRTVYILNERIYKIVHLLGEISKQLSYFCFLQQKHIVTESLLIEVVSDTAKKCDFTDRAVITALKTNLTTPLGTDTKIQSVSYQFALMLETMTQIGLAINDIDNPFPMTKHTKQ